MATSGQIQRIFVEQLGVAFGTARRYTGDLMRGGLIHEGKHGVAAMNWTTSEVTNLLIALASGVPLVTLADSVREVRELSSEQTGHTAGSAIDNLIDEFCGGAVDREIALQFYNAGSGVEIIDSDVCVVFGNVQSEFSLSIIHKIDASRLLAKVADAMNDSSNMRPRGTGRHWRE